MGFEQFQHLPGNFGINQIVGETHGGPQDNQYAPHEHHAFFHNFRQIFPADIPIENHLHQQYVNGRYGCGFTDRKLSAVNPA